VALTVAIGNLFMKATITLEPKQFTGTVDATVMLPVATATKVFRKEEVVPATGKVSVASAASGTVRFYNPTAAKKTIAKGTVIISSAKGSYAVDKAVTLPPGTVKKPGQADAVVHALETGGQANRGLDDFTFATSSKAFEGVTIHSVTPMTGGANGEDAVADPASIDAAKERLQASWPDAQTLVGRVAHMIPGAMMVLPAPALPTALAFSIDAGHEDGVHVVATQKVTVFLVGREIIGRKLGDMLNAPKEVRFVPGALDDLSFVSLGTESAGLMPVRISGTARIRGAVDDVAIRQQAAGLSKSRVRELVGSMAEIQDMRITVMPPWRRLLPGDPDRIEVRMR
jgi:hypothetical protein